MDRIFLSEPIAKYCDQVMKIKKDFLDNNETFAGCALLEKCESYDEWIDFEGRLSKAYGDSYVPSSVYLGVRKSDNKVIGIIDFRHDLSDFLFNYGGNIGYSVVIDERRKGYAKEMLRILLDKCKNEYGKDKVLLTCDRENIASMRTIMANGGVFENEVIDDVGISESGVIQRYWIGLD